MLSIFSYRYLSALLAGAFVHLEFVGPAAAHEGVGRAGLRRPLEVEIESEFYFGRRGYLHGGLGVVAPISENQKIGVVGHFVREEFGSDIFPSLGAEYIRRFASGVEFEVFSFAYVPVESQRALALGARVSKKFTLENDISATPFFGPAYSRVRALDEEAGDIATIGHLMLLGGLEFRSGIWSVTVFGTHSEFSRNPHSLETHVDLEEMTHFAAYENNDGFARNSAGFEVSVEPTDRISLSARYAWIDFPNARRHSLAFVPTIKLSDHLHVFAGVQFLRGGEGNTLGTFGIAKKF
jgi:hypothetical protein